MEYFAGVDEAGRGPLAGPVIAAAVILDPNVSIAGLKDSKQISAKQRNACYELICKHAIAYAIGRSEVFEIDQLNILQASLLAMQRAVNALSVSPHSVWIDGLHKPNLNYPMQTIIKGDQKIPAISAASILAKVVRDREMELYDKQFPGYDFAQHKGYPTKRHLKAICELGITSIHRRSFKPVKAYSQS